MTEQERKWKDGIYTNGRRDYHYLIGIKIKYQLFSNTNSNDHTHCELCWDKISTYPNDLHHGYATLDNKTWLCPECVADFKLLFDWVIINDISEFNSDEQS